MSAGFWRQVCSWVLEGTYLEVVPNAAGGWLVVDSRRPDYRLAEALTSGKAKGEAERLAAEGGYHV